jgi:hypothetical protein
MTENIHELLPSDIIKKVLTDHCDIKSVAKFQMTSSVSNIPDVKEFMADQVTNTILQQMFDNVFEYHTLLNNRTELRGMMKPAMQTFVDTALGSLMKITTESEQRQEVEVKRILGRIKARMRLSSASLMQILRAFQYDTPVPDALSEESQSCYTMFIDYFAYSPVVWKMYLDTHEMYINVSSKIWSFVISANDIDKVNQIKPETFIVVPLKIKNRPNDAAIIFKITLENIEHFGKIIQHLYGRYALVKKDTIEVDLKLSTNILVKKVMQEFQQTHFTSVIKI